MFLFRCFAPKWIATFTLLIVTSASSATAEVILQVQSDKDVYLVDEPIWLDVIVKNDGENTEIVPGPQPITGEFQILLIRGIADTLEAVGARASFLENTDASVDHGDTTFSTINILDEFGIAESIALFRSLEVGSYSVSACYPGRTRSNMLHFRIEDPSGEEDFAHSTYIAAILEREPNPESAVANAKTVISDYPHSVYAPAACNLIRQVYSVFTPNHEKAQDWAVYVVTHYPKSGYALQLQSFLVMKYGQEKAANIANDIVEKHPDNVRFRLGTSALRRY